MTQLEEWECIEIYSNIQFSDRNMIESARLISYFASLPYMKEKVEISEFMSLPWDKDEDADETNISNIEISDGEIKKLKQKANNIKQMMKGKI